MFVLTTTDRLTRERDRQPGVARRVNFVKLAKPSNTRPGESGLPARKPRRGLRVQILVPTPVPLRSRAFCGKGGSGRDVKGDPRHPLRSRPRRIIGRPGQVKRVRMTNRELFYSRARREKMEQSVGRNPGIRLRAWNDEFCVSARRTTLMNFTTTMPATEKWTPARDPAGVHSTASVLLLCFPVRSKRMEDALLKARLTGLTKSLIQRI